MEVPLLKTPTREKRDALDMEIYTDFQKLMSVKGQSKTEVYKYLQNKHDIGSTATIYRIIHRVENRLKKEV